jgi:hypothetical protein
MNKRQPIELIPSQRARFIAAARELECDESEGAFEARLKQIASAKPKGKPAKARKQKK